MISLTGACLPEGNELSTADIAPAIVSSLISESYARKIFEDARGVNRLGVTGKSVILILIDGLGWNLLHRYRGHARNLWRLACESTPAFTCAPSTTAAAITTVMTGKSPASTNMVGYSVYWQGKHSDLITMSALPNEIHRWQPCSPLSEVLTSQHVPVYAVIPQKFRQSGLTEAALRGANFTFANTIAQRVNATVQGISRCGLTYSYWAEVDHAGHSYGPGSTQWIAALEEVDSEIGRILGLARGKSQVVLVADHGMITANPAAQIDLADDSNLARDVHTIAGEPRAVQVHCEPGKASLVLKAWSERLADRAWVIPAKHLGVVMGGVNSLVGDFVVFAKEQTTIVDSRFQSDVMIAMPGVHGSLTEDEMLVPLLVQK